MTMTMTMRFNPESQKSCLQGRATAGWLLLLILCLLSATGLRAQQLQGDSLTLTEVMVMGKSKVQQLREGAYAVSVIDTRQLRNGTQNLAEVISRTAGIRLRQKGGLGADYDLSVDGMSGNAIRYCIDGIPMAAMGAGVNLQNIPLGSIDRVEIYKGVVPTEFGTDALGGVVNIVTRKSAGDYLDASVSAGSFHTYGAEVSGKWTHGRTGIFLRPQVSYTHSDNDYMMHEVKVWSEAQDAYVLADRRRFHDGYDFLTASVETGLENRSWADALTLGVSYTSTRKELQTGAIQTKVYGMAQREQDAWNIQVRYRKADFLVPGLKVNALLSHTWDNTLVADSARRRYDWNGDYVPTDRNETNGRQPMMRDIRRPLLVGHATLSYPLGKHHSLGLNYMVTSMGNNRSDRLMLDDDFQPSRDRMAKHILGLTLGQEFFSGRLSNQFFLKDYAFRVSIGQTDFAWKTNLREVGSSIHRNLLGGGAASRFRIWDALSIRLGYERAVRLPLARELLGNGSTVYANLALRPETSHNVNLGLFGQTAFGTAQHRLSYDVNAFYRNVDDYIRAVVSEAEGTYQHENVQDVDVKGIEGELRYSYSFGRHEDRTNRIQLASNVTYQHAINMNATDRNGRPSVTYRNRIPNKPWLFSNVEASYVRQGLLRKDDRLSLGYQYQYVHWFYLTWEGYGALQSKNRIPTQHCQSASLTYAWHADRYAVTLSCDNLTDALLYDNFMLQKPGRSIMGKIRVYLH